jgi:predicted DNA-binding protein (MmcQ/YjbR family)
MGRKRMTLNHNRLLELGLNFAGTSVKYPFRFDLPVLYVKGKMFALLGRHGEFESVNLKASPEEAGLQRQAYPGSVLPGYHMNKEHWNTVVLDGTIPDDVIVEMLIDSYQRVIAKMPKKDRVGLE